MPTENKAPALTEKQKCWIYRYRDHVGTEPLFMEDLEGGVMGFCCFAQKNIESLRDNVRRLENLLWEMEEKKCKDIPFRDLLPGEKGRIERHHRKLEEIRQRQVRYIHAPDSTPRHHAGLPKQDARCATGKRRYKSWHEAKKVARIQMRREAGVTLRAYRCRACGGWHLTSMQWKQKKPRVRS